MKILLFGKGGQVGWELQRALAPLGELVALDFDSTAHCGSFSNLAGIAATVQAIKPDVIVNAAAHTAVDKAESEPELASLLNAQAPTVLAQEAQKLGAWLLHYSTDYVFNGSGTRPWRETDAPAPLNVYGHTKLAGELGVAQHCSKHIILRTSWVYAARGGNFAKTMLKLAQERSQLKVINDQHGAPTGAELLADVSALALRQALQGAAAQPSCAGLYHLVAGGETTWFDYANYVLERARAAQPAIKIIASEVLPVPTSMFPTPAQRPHNSRLDCSKLQATFGLRLPHWQAGVERMLAEYLSH